MYFVEQYKRQFQSLCVNYVDPEGRETGLDEVPKTPDPALLDPTKLAERAGRLSFGIGKRIEDADARIAQVGDIKPDDLSMGKEIDQNAKPEKPEEFPVGKEVTPNLSESIDQKMYDGLLEKYGKERLDSMSKIYEELKGTEGFKAPQTIEEFEALMKNRLVDGQQAGLIGDADVPGEESVVEGAASEMLGGASSGQLGAYAAPSGAPNYPSSSLKLSPGEAVANDAQLQEAINHPDISPQAKKLLETAGGFLGKNERDHNSELRDFLKLDPSKTAWCKAFVNKCCEANGIPLNSSGSLFSLDSMNDGRLLNQNEEPLPGDLVMVRRNGGGHIGFCLGMSANGKPIILGGNQGERGEVSIKEETRELVGITRITESTSGNPSGLTS